VIDAHEYLHACDALHAVAKNIARFDNAQREQILLGVAVLYGIVPILKGAPPRAPGHPRMKPGTIRSRTLDFVNAKGTTTTGEILAHLADVNPGAVMAGIAKLKGSGQIAHIAHGTYQSNRDTPCMSADGAGEATDK
jgi:hypothetical protein